MTKRDKFDFLVVNFSFIDDGNPEAPSNGIYIAKLFVLVINTSSKTNSEGLIACPE